MKFDANEVKMISGIRRKGDTDSILSRVCMI